MDTFEQRLSKELIRATSLVILIVLLLFSSILLGANYYNYRTTVNANANRLNEFVSYLHDNNAEMFEKIEEVMLKNNDSNTSSAILEEFYAINSKSLVPSSVIVLSNQEIVLTTFAKYQINDHMRLFIDYLIRSMENDEIAYRSYAYSKDVTYLISAYKVSKNDTIILIQEKDRLDALLMKRDIQGVLVDPYSRVIASSNIIFNLRSDNKFYNNEAIFNEEKYDIREVSDTSLNMNAYALSKTNSITTALYLGILFLFLFYFLVLFFFKKSIKKIAKKQLQSFNTLISEINIVAKENIDHELSTKSNDEFEMIANEINKMNATIRQLSDNNAELRYRGKISELKRLEAQFDPHFLYNTLDAVRYSSYIDPDIASDMIIRLTKILRYSIDNNELSVPLRVDMDFIELYCEIQKYRFNESFSYRIEVDEDCLDLEIPKLCLQPLIENSIQNSFINKASAHIAIRIFKRDHFMVMEVEDDGIGMKEDKLETLRESLHDHRQLENHHGLYNTYRRVQLIYGSRCTIHIESEYKKGTKVLLILDLSKGEV